jgi:hypothetical protein
MTSGRELMHVPCRPAVIVKQHQTHVKCLVHLVSCMCSQGHAGPAGVYRQSPVSSAPAGHWVVVHCVSSKTTFLEKIRIQINFIKPGRTAYTLRDEQMNLSATG